MKKLIETLNTIDDDYLVGLSNKGTVKRAYKELESAEITAEYMDDCAEVSVLGEKCTITQPLGESKCTCPSRSICRHIITSILWLKNNSSDSADTSDAHAGEGVKTPPQTLVDKLSAYSTDNLQKAMKKTYFTAFSMKYKSGNVPEIEETSVIKVTFPNENITVKLIEPLEFSTCTCHSKELCRHKAAAILAWQLKNGITSLDICENQKTDSVKLNVEAIHNTAVYVKRFLSGLLSDGLVRAGDNIAEQSESAAVMCHNSRLADWEKYMRELGNRLQGYVSHSPQFDANVLFALIMDTIALADNIINCNDTDLLKNFTGEFKSTYAAAGTIDILPVAQRHFSSESGYEGQIFYFVNMNANAEERFLTYSAVRPTFYDNSRRNSRLAAPWGLAGGIGDIMCSQLRLYSAKLSGNKLSSSNDTKADFIEPVNLNQPAVYKLIYSDFAKMVKETFASRRRDGDERLVFIAPKACVSSVSDEISQTHYLGVEDIFGRRLTVKMRYKSESKDFFARFKRISDMMRNEPQKQFVIFGSAYIENGKCFVYPIAIYDSIEYNIITKDNAGISAKDTEHHYDYFVKLFSDIKRMMCDIIQCGINSFDMYEEIREYSAESGKMGMLLLSEKLNVLCELLSAKNHSYSSDNSRIIAVLSDIYVYIKTGIRYTEIDMALSEMSKNKE